MEQREFSFCEKALVKKYSKLEPISRTLIRYIQKLTENTEEKIANMLPDKFAIVFDAWTHNTDHFLALFAAFNDCQVLLALAPLLDEDFSATSHVEFMIATLRIYRKSSENILVCICDNENLNKCISN